MKEKEEKDIKGQNKKKKKKEEEELPFCTTAPSAEHARSDLEDDPCDDFRDGEYCASRLPSA
jgi:hypothetical protein